MFKPLKITFNLVSPVIPPDGGLLHLDGLLAYAVVQEALLDPAAKEKDFPTLQSGLNNVLDVESRDGESVFKASCIKFVGIDPTSNGGQVMMTRRTEVDGIAAAKEAFDLHGSDLGNEDIHHAEPMLADQRKNGEFVSLRMGKIETGKGALRNHQFFLPTTMARCAVGYCIGDADAVQRLCNTHIKSIGRKGAAGYGMVKSVTVEIDEDAHSIWALRHLPWPIDGYVPVEGNTAPPYWDASRKKKVWVPINL